MQKEKGAYALLEYFNCSVSPIAGDSLARRKFSHQFVVRLTLLWRELNDVTGRNI